MGGSVQIPDEGKITPDIYSTLTIPALLSCMLRIVNQERARRCFQPGCSTPHAQSTLHTKTKTSGGFCRHKQLFRVRLSLGNGHAERQAARKSQNSPHTWLGAGCGRCAVVAGNPNAEYQLFSRRRSARHGVSKTRIFLHGRVRSKGRRRWSGPS